MGGTGLRARSLQPTDLALNASSCHHGVIWGQSLLSNEPHFPHLSNDVDHIIAPGSPGQRSSVDFEGSKGNLGKCLGQSSAHSKGFLHLFRMLLSFPCHLDLGTP